MTDITDNELLEKFITQTLTTEERAVFNHKMQSDPAFMADVKAHLQLVALLKTRKDLEIAEEWEKESVELAAPKLVHFYRQRKYQAAAVLLIGILLSVFVYQMQKDDKDYPLLAQNMFEAYQKTDKENPIVKEKRENITDNEEVKRLQAQFRQGDSLMTMAKTSEAVAVYQQIVSIYPNQESAHFYLGLAYFQQKNYVNSLKEWDFILSHSASVELVDMAKWYKALSHFALNQAKEGKEAMNTISKDSPYFERIKYE